MATSPVNSAGFYADFGKLESLRATAQKDPQAAVKAAAKQFEGIFMQMMLKSMRTASLGEGMGDSEETKFYQDMFDQQLSVQLASGKGMGLADKLVQQLQSGGLVPGATTAQDKPVARDKPAASGLSLAVDAPAPAPLRPPVINGVQPAASPAAAPTGTAAPTAATRSQREQFIASIRPAAERIAQQLGVGSEAIIAHAALETGWGRHLPAAGGNNLFGIKAGGSWQGPGAQATTTEVTGGQPQLVQASFRSYESVSAGLADYARVLASPRYASALSQGGDVAAFARGLQRGGYATDPAYADKLIATATAVRQLVAAPRLKIATAVPTMNPGATA
jgi:peptidoglycan hydrolase FlgJ